jgi:uncharacterized protein YbaA (DUF1428 family)
MKLGREGATNDVGAGQSPELAEAVSLAVDDLTVFTWGSMRDRDVHDLVDAIRARFG